MHQQRLLARGADARHLVERAGAHRLRALVAMRADREAVHLVAQPLEIEQHRGVDRQLELAPVHQVEHLAPVAAVMRALGDADQADVLDPHFLQHRLRRVELPAPAVDQHEVGPFAAVAIGVLGLRAGEAALEHLAHHREIVVGRRAPDVELAVLALAEPLRPGDDHRAQRVGALDMAVVVDLDALRRLGQLEQVGDLAQQFRLRGRFGQPPVERLDRVALCLIHQAAAIPPLRHRQRDLIPRALAQRLGQQPAFRQIAVEQDRPRRRHLLIELGQERGEHLVLGHVGGVRGKEAPVPPILPATDEERLHADHPVLRRQREHVGVADPLGIDRLTALDEGQRLQPVAQHGGQFEVHALGRRLHLLAQLGLHPGRLARQEILGVADQFGIAARVDPPDARRRASLDLVQQARPVARLEEAVGARAQQEQLLERVQRVVDRSRAGERAVVIALGAPCAAMLLDAREIVIGAQQDERERFVVAQQHVVRGPEPLDELRLEQQRLGLVVGRHDRHRPRLRHHPLEPAGQAIDLRIIGHAILQRARLADVQDVSARVVHPVHARPRGQGFQDVADRRHPRRQVGRLGAAHGIGGLFLVEPVGGVGRRHRIRR